VTINGGSSSIKFALYQVGESLKRKLCGKIDRICERLNFLDVELNEL
jgi:acetate kinase